MTGQPILRPRPFPFSSGTLPAVVVDVVVEVDDEPHVAVVDGAEHNVLVVVDGVE